MHRLILCNLLLILGLPTQAETLASAPCDVDGNGVSELVVGAPGEAVNGVKGAGAVHVQYSVLFHYDTPSFLEDGDELLATPQQHAGVGEAIACGDFNGDGVGDLAIGAPGRHGGRGSVTVIYGIANVGVTGDSYVIEITEDLLANLPTTGEPGDHFGAALTVGDFNGDQVDDLAIGAPWDSDSGAAGVSGAAFVVLGAQDNMWSFLFGYYIPPIMVGQYCEDEYSWRPSIALAAGDFLGGTTVPGGTGIVIPDGRDELAIGLPECGYGVLEGPRLRDPPQMGMVDIAQWDPAAQTFTNGIGGIYRHPEALAFPTDLDLALDLSGDMFGSALAAGDLNGDGWDDLVVGSPFERGIGSDFAGAVWFFPGGEDDFGTPGQVKQSSYLGGDEKFDMFGGALAVGDVDGDARPDLVVGTPGQALKDGAEPLSGSVWVLREFRLGTFHAHVADVLAPGVGLVAGEPQTDDYFGDRVALIDANADGNRDLVVGVPGKDFGPAKSKITDAGAIHILIGGADETFPFGSFVYDQSLSYVADEPENSSYSPSYEPPVNPCDDDVCEPGAHSIGELFGLGLGN